MMANDHIAFAEGSRMLESPMPDCPLRRELLQAPLPIENDRLTAPDSTGLGVILTPEIVQRHAFREDAADTCLEDPDLLPDESVWTAPMRKDGSKK